MAEASASCKSKTQKALRVSNDVVSAHQQLREEDEKKKKGERITDEEEGGGEGVDQSRSLRDGTCAKINEIFGNDEVVIRPPKKQKKYRSLQSIYTATMPITVEADKTTIINANV